ncbi:MAG TPA: mechanosensitive ion channel family protein, partial [Kiloniellales bacterium]|nr:mechanosensitive ion channel family protein [Kiloniellales bacterium]
NATRVILGVVVVMIVFSELGVDIAPLLAGAGVVGLAIGFGAQTLVKDVITGVFILLEGSVRVGDVVDLGGHAGIVESLTIRTVVLRDLQGTVHVVPFSSVTTVRNMTMDYAYAFMDVGIAYREDVDQVIEVLKEVGADLQADETFGPEILEPLEVLGLDSFGDSSVNIRIRLKTRPIKQWMIRREFNRRMKRVFDERGIEIPFPHRTLYFGVDKEGKAPPAYIRSERHEMRDSPEAPQISGPDESAAQTRPAGSGTPDPT